MGFLRDILPGAGGAAGAAGAAQAAAPMVKPGTVIGRRLFGDENAGRVADIANRIGTGANMIAAGGGAAPGYAAPQGYQEAEAAPVNNHMQMLDPEVLQALIARFRPTGVRY